MQPPLILPSCALPFPLDDGIVDRGRMRLSLQGSPPGSVGAYLLAQLDEASDGRPMVRETPPGYGAFDDRLDRMERMLGAVATDVRVLKQDVAVLADAVRMIADGYQETQRRLADVAELLKRYISA